MIKFCIRFDNNRLPKSSKQTMNKSKSIGQSQIKNTKKKVKNSSIQQQFLVQSSSKRKQEKFLKDIQIQFDQFQELIQKVNIQSCVNDQTKGLNVKKLISLLESKYSIFSKDKLIKFYLSQGEIYLTIPSNKKSFSMFQIEEDDYLSAKTLKLQMLKNRELIDVVVDDSQEQSDEYADDEQEADNDQRNLEGKCRRLKQRKIKHVVEKVLKWRQLYAPENGNESQRISLEEGAKIVSISKKTLDDYLAQLKKGKKYGFNFNDHRNQKIGVLREFIRKSEKKK